jgi:tetratricopeptide (TPR) repeat protein
LTAWRKEKRQEDLQEARRAYEMALARYPNHALYQAQLAWVLHLSGEASLARSAAEKAYELDQKMPHQELKLSRRHVTDPDFSQKPPRTVLAESAEQTVERLRTASAEDKP